MTRQEAVYGLWIWAVTAALLPELGFFLVYIGFSGMAQAGFILLLAWVLFKRVRGAAVFPIVVFLAAMNGPPLYFIDTIFGRLADFDHFLKQLNSALGIMVLRSAIMLLALAPLGVFYFRTPRIQ
jgi:hypothetical protein